MVCNFILPPYDCMSACYTRGWRRSSRTLSRMRAGCATNMRLLACRVKELRDLPRRLARPDRARDYPRRVEAAERRPRGNVVPAEHNVHAWRVRAGRHVHTRHDASVRVAVRETHAVAKVPQHVPRAPLGHARRVRRLAARRRPRVLAQRRDHALRAARHAGWFGLLHGHARMSAGDMRPWPARVDPCEHVSQFRPAHGGVRARHTARARRAQRDAGRRGRVRVRGGVPAGVLDARRGLRAETAEPPVARRRRAAQCRRKHGPTTDM